MILYGCKILQHFVTVDFKMKRCIFWGSEWGKTLEQQKPSWFSPAATVDLEDHPAVLVADPFLAQDVIMEIFMYIIYCTYIFIYTHCIYIYIYILYIYYTVYIYTVYI